MHHTLHALLDHLQGYYHGRSIWMSKYSLTEKVIRMREYSDHSLEAVLGPWNGCDRNCRVFFLSWKKFLSIQMAKLQRETTKARRRKVQCCWKANFCLRIFQFPRFIIRVRLFNVGLQFLAAKVAFSSPSADRIGKKNLGLITWGQIKSVPNFC